jgi:hypothetical protein
MSEPLTTVDPRFSDEGAVSTPWSATRDAIEYLRLSGQAGKVFGIRQRVFSHTGHQF